MKRYTYTLTVEGELAEAFGIVFRAFALREVNPLCTESRICNECGKDATYPDYELCDECREKEKPCTQTTK